MTDQELPEMHATNLERADDNRAPGRTKIYIMAGAATGKSTFASKHETYRGYRIVDYTEQIPTYTLTTRLLLYFSRVIKPLRRIAVKRPEMAQHFKGAYFERAIEFLDNQDEPIVVMGRRTSDSFDHAKYNDKIDFAIVLIPEEKHRQHCATRKKQLRNPLPFMHHWSTNFEKIKAVRAQFEAHAQRHGIPIYESIEAAINDIASRNR